MDSQSLRDLADLQREETATIQSIYSDIFKDVTPVGLVWNKKPCPHFQIQIDSSVASDRPTLSLCLDIELTATYPLSPPLVKVLNPRNILNPGLVAINNSIRTLIEQYPQQEICYILISETISLLDEIQQTTETVLSLEQEREERLRYERDELDRREASQHRKQKNLQKIQKQELTHQLLRIKGDYDDSQSSSKSSSSKDGSDPLAGIPLPSDLSLSFVFDNIIVGQWPQSRTKYKFRAVTGMIKCDRTDLLSCVSLQFIVKPFLAKQAQEKSETHGADQLFLLTRIHLKSEFWDTDSGKKQVQELESELQLASRINHENINKLYGFQIDKVVANPGWTIHLLTEYSSSLDILSDIVSSAEYIRWALARNWLIQLLPAFEYLHNAGFTHKLVCPQAIVAYKEAAFDSDDQVPPKVLKLCHPSYGFRLLEMLQTHPNNPGTELFSSTYLPREWLAPELQANPPNYHQKTDIWDLGVLFLRIMFSYNVLWTDFRSPQKFHALYSDHDRATNEYSALVYDMLSKMLSPKISKRLSPLDLNATQFMRDGPVLDNADNLHRRIALLNVDDKPDNDQLTVARPVGPVTTTTRRYSSHANSENAKASFPAAAGLGVGRYERDFEEVGRLGKGGFGEVFKARSRMEGAFYAIKKIKHRAHKLDSLLSEVLSLARLNHQYIVRYYGTWVEQERNDHAIEDSASDSGSDLESNSESEINAELSTTRTGALTSFLTSKDNLFQVDYVTHSFDADVEFAFSSDEDNEGSDNFVFGVLTSANSIKLDSSESFSGKLVVSKSKPDIVPQVSKSILYIQMEFCENNTLLNLIELGLPSNRSEYWRLFRQLLEAVSYIHQEGFIHRDLKPLNIFIDRQNNVKVGDFGLAKNSQFSLIIATNNQISAEKSKELSTLVGTVFYTANEVATGNYDEKVDEYSLGIMFFEMCCTLKTGMERAHILNNLRLASVTFPPDFTDSKFLTEKKIIRLLLDHDPQKRTSCYQLLQSGWLPVEHQDQVIKEALRSLADPASPWQQQVRQTLFDQPYLLAKDLMFDSTLTNRGLHANLDQSNPRHLLFSTMISKMFGVFKNHGAIEEFSGNVLLPRTPLLNSESVYLVLDKSGQVLALPYDLVLPHARRISRMHVNEAKTFRHEFVYRSSLRNAGCPDSYSAIGFDVSTSDQTETNVNDAECLKVIDELLESFPCFKTKNSQVIIDINHYDILDAIISFAFGNIGIGERKRLEVMGVLSQFGVDKNEEEIKRLLKDDLNVPHTVAKELLDRFNFSLEPHAAMQKLTKIMVDSPHLIKVERAFKDLLQTLKILQCFGITNTVHLCPLANYNSQYYVGGVMFQALFRLDKSRKYARIATGGRYDSLVSTLGNEEVARSTTHKVVGFTWTSTFVFSLMKNMAARKLQSDLGLEKWTGTRCEVLVVFARSNSQSTENAYDLLDYIWKRGIAGDYYFSGSADDAMSKAKSDGIPWLVFVKQLNTQSKLPLHRSGSKTFKPFRARNIHASKDTDVDHEGVVSLVLTDREERSHDSIDPGDKFNSNEESETLGRSTDELNPLFSVDIDQKIVVVPHDAPKGRKSAHKKAKWEVENDAKIALAQMLKQVAASTVITVDARDEVIDMISVTSIHQQDEWVKKVIFVTNNMGKSYILNIHGALMKEHDKGRKWAIVCSAKSHKTAVVDLDR